MRFVYLCEDEERIYFDRETMNLYEFERFESNKNDWARWGMYIGLIVLGLIVPWLYRELDSPVYACGLACVYSAFMWVCSNREIKLADAHYLSIMKKAEKVEFSRDIRVRCLIRIVLIFVVLSLATVAVAVWLVNSAHNVLVSDSSDMRLRFIIFLLPIFLILVWVNLRPMLTLRCYLQSKKSCRAKH